MKYTTLLFLAVFSFWATHAHASVYYWDAASGGNNHYYEYVGFSEKTNWTSAKKAAESLGGYLGTATSSAENNYMWNVVLSKRGGDVALGGFQASSNGPWEWVTGEAWDYTNWKKGNSNSNHGGESYLVYWNKKNYWKDVNNKRSLKGMLVEYDDDPSVPAVPVPAAAWLLGSGLVGVFGWRRKNKS